MEPFISAFWTGKAGCSAEEYEDACAWSSNRRHFAIADGATESSFADRWARSLVEKYTRERPAPAGGSTSLPDWVKPLQKEWHAEIPWDNLPWFAEEKARSGAFSTLLGISFSAPGTRAAPRRIIRWPGRNTDAERLHWRAFAIGDSCFFQVRSGRLLKAFPIEHSCNFNHRPVLLSSNPGQNGPVWKQITTAEGDCREGDHFFALTDSLAKWFLTEAERGGKPWRALGEVQDQKGFEAFVQECRLDRALRNDDTTLLSMQWVKRMEDHHGAELRVNERRTP